MGSVVLAFSLPEPSPEISSTHLVGPVLDDEVSVSHTAPVPTWIPTRSTPRSPRAPGLPAMEATWRAAHPFRCGGRAADRTGPRRAGHGRGGGGRRSPGAAADPHAGASPGRSRGLAPAQAALGDPRRGAPRPRAYPTPVRSWRRSARPGNSRGRGLLSRWARWSARACVASWASTLGGQLRLWWMELGTGARRITAVSCAGAPRVWWDLRCGSSSGRSPARGPPSADRSQASSAPRPSRPASGSARASPGSASTRSPSPSSSWPPRAPWPS